jgi:DNA modification methylase
MQAADIVLDPFVGSDATAVAAEVRAEGRYTVPQLKVLTWPRNRITSIRRWDDSRNRLIAGDNLEVLRDMPDSFVALVYADPPFFTQRDWGSSPTGGTGPSGRSSSWRRRIVRARAG